MKFKTNINCDSCVAKVTPVLEANEQVENWKVDTANPDKVLTVEGEDIDVEDLVHSLKKIGYRAEKIEE
ncbi:MAG: heavy-metal-associated domain-containing protein [Leadbetterella sp.]|nr:heavy-metal-associated domain-containing protein [Leadbetterella sp.]